VNFVFPNNTDSGNLKKFLFTDILITDRRIYVKR